MNTEIILSFILEDSSETRKVSIHFPLSIIIIESQTLVTKDRSCDEIMNRFPNCVIFLIAFSKTRFLHKIGIRQVKYLNNIVEQDHRFIKKITRPMLGFKTFHSAKATLSGIELHHMLKKGQHINPANMTIFEQFYALAA